MALEINFALNMIKSKIEDPPPYIHHDFTNALCERLPFELRTMIYDYLLDEERYLDVANRFYSANRGHFLKQKELDKNIIMEFSSWNINMAQEVALRFYSTIEFPCFEEIESVDRFMHHDFFGVGVRPVDAPLPRLIVYMKRPEHNLLDLPMEPATFQAIMRPEQKLVKDSWLEVYLHNFQQIILRQWRYRGDDDEAKKQELPHRVFEQVASYQWSLPRDYHRGTR